MISYKRKKETFTEPLDEQLFYKLLRDRVCNANIDKFRQTGIERYKSCLPAFCFQANFDETVKEVKNRKTGETKKVKARWSVQKATNLTGLVVLDIDHVGSPLEIYERWKSFDFNQLGILFVFITPSGKGLKVVFKANVQWGNLSDNQNEMGRILGVEPDESGKDASRIAFICKEEDVLYLNKELFTYEDKIFARKFNAQYRNGRSAPTKIAGKKALPLSKGEYPEGGRECVDSDVNTLPCLLNQGAVPHDNVMGDSFRVEQSDQPLSVGTGVAGTHGYYAETLSASTKESVEGDMTLKASPNNSRGFEEPTDQGAAAPKALPLSKGEYPEGGREYVDAEGSLLESSPQEPASKSFKGIPYAVIINEWWKQQGGEPQMGERNTELHRLAVHLRTICDNNPELLLEIMPNYGLDVTEMESIIASATKDQPKGKTKEIKAVLQTLGVDALRNKALPLSKGEYPPQEGEGVCYSSREHTPPSLRATPSNLRGGVQEYVGEGGSMLTSRGGTQEYVGAERNVLTSTEPPQDSADDIDQKLWLWGEQIEQFFDVFPMLRESCKNLIKSQYPAALFVSGGMFMTLMTRCTYRFYDTPEKLRRLNCAICVIADPASGKSFATRLDNLIMVPLKETDKAGTDAINSYREIISTKGANKDKPKKPKSILRNHPSRTSNKQFIEDMVNAVEEVDGEQMQLHMYTFDSEFDNSISVQKGGSWIEKLSMELKAFHNEVDGQAYSNSDSVVKNFQVTWNYIYTGTPLALRKKVNDRNFGTGLVTRLTCIPLPSSHFRMMERQRVIDYESDKRLTEWAYRLDKTKGELNMGKIVDELYDWTARRMEEAEMNNSKGDEMLLKRCAYHGLNFAAPFIMMRHWDELRQDGDFRYGDFETDETDWRLAELLTNIQYACQRHFFGSMAANYFDNQARDNEVIYRQRQTKTVEAYHRLPEEFTTDDVMHCFGVNNDAARATISRLQRDHLVVKLKSIVENGHSKSIYQKKGTIF